MKKRNDKEYIKQMQKQIVSLKEYIVKLENEVNNSEIKINKLKEKTKHLIEIIIDEFGYYEENM